jgi:SAM-dependent methyltransferase
MSGQSTIHRSPSDVWATGDAYEGYMGRWSRPVAQQFLSWLALKPNQRWVDVGCGTGALTMTILAAAAPHAVVGVDPSDGFIAHARRQIQDPRATFQSGDAQNLPLEDGAFDAVVSGLVLNFVPDPARAISEMMRVIRPGGTIAAYVWDYAEGMQFLRYFWAAAVALNPAAQELDEGRRFPLCRPAALLSLLDDAGLQQTEVYTIEVPSVFEDFDDYWSPFLGGQGPAPSYCAALTEEQRAELKDRLSVSLPVQSDGRIRLIARALVVRGGKMERTNIAPV